MDPKLREFTCSLSYQNDHFIEKPILLVCGHAACFECIQALKIHTGFRKTICLKCKKENSLENDYTESEMIKNYLTDNATKIIETVQEQYDELLRTCSKKVNEMSEHVNVQIEYFKDEVEIRAESLKLEIDVMKNALIDKLDSIRLNFEKNIKKRIEEKHDIMNVGPDAIKLTEEKLNLSMLQTKVKELQNSLDYLESINSQISLNVNEELLSKKLSVNVHHCFDNLVEKIAEKDFQFVNLECEPYSLYTMPNDTLVIVSRESRNFMIYDREFNLIKTIEKINNKIFKPYYITSDGDSKVFITELIGNQIIQTDLDFNFVRQFGSKGSSNETLDFPTGITFNEGSIYICDGNNKRIQKLNSEELLFEESFPLSFKPINIKIIKNVACIKPDKEPFIAIYCLIPFSFKVRINNSSHQIFSLNSYFYMFNANGNRLSSYDINGNLIEKKSLEIPKTITSDCCQHYSIGYFNEKFIITASKTKKIIILQ